MLFALTQYCACRQIESYKDSEERAIESNEKELKTAIEKAQEHIRRAQVIVFGVFASHALPHWNLDRPEYLFDFLSWPVL